MNLNIQITKVIQSSNSNITYIINRLKRKIHKILCASRFLMKINSHVMIFQIHVVDTGLCKHCSKGCSEARYYNINVKLSNSKHS